MIAPAERFDVIVDFSQYQPGDEVTLRQQARTATRRQVMRFKVARKATDDSRIPAKLSSLRRLPEAGRRRPPEVASSAAATPAATGWTINGKPFDPDR